MFSYISREELEKRGLSKLVQQADARMAALAAGTDNRPVTTKEIQAHLDDFALAKEFSVYGKIGGLSGGQKVCVCVCEIESERGRESLWLALARRSSVDDALELSAAACEAQRGVQWL